MSGERQVFCAITRRRGKMPSAICSSVASSGLSFQTCSLEPRLRGLVGIDHVGWVLGGLVGHEGPVEPCTSQDSYAVRMSGRYEPSGPFT